MGTFISRFREGTYYANFEKSLEKINTAKERIQQRKTRRGEVKKALTRRVVYFGFMLSILASVYVAWVYKQPIEQFSHNGRVLRTSLIVDIPLLMILIHQFVLWCFGFLLRWDDRLLNKLEKTFNEMLSDLKDQNHYNRLVELLQKYDPEEQEKQKLLESAKHPPPPPQSSPPVSETASEQPATPKSSSIGGSLISGAGRVLDKLANGLIGDQPELVDELEELKNMLQVLEKRNRELEEENKSLKEQLKSLSIPEQESES